MMRMNVLLCIGMLVLVVGSTTRAQAPDEGRPQGEPSTQRKTLLDFIQAGGLIGYVILALSLVGAAVVFDAFLRLRIEKVLPPLLVEQSRQLALQGKFPEMLAMSRTSQSMLGRIISGSLPEGKLGVLAVRQAMQGHGAREVTRLRQRVGYIGFIASVAPMLGLLGTVTGMIHSFNVMGVAKGAARPDELAVGISEALVTTSIGLIVAVPMMFLYSLLRDRVTRVGQESAGVCEGLYRLMVTAVESRAAGAKASAKADGDSPAP